MKRLKTQNYGLHLVYYNCSLYRTDSFNSKTLWGKAKNWIWEIRFLVTRIHSPNRVDNNKNEQTN